MPTILGTEYETPRSETQENQPGSQNHILLATVESAAEKTPEAKMFINTQGPKRKQPITHESAGEDVGSLLFSWCERITSFILRESEVSSAISCDNIYSSGKGQKTPLKLIPSFSYSDSVKKTHYQ